MRKSKIERSCYSCKKHWNIYGKPCPNEYKEGFNPCEKFEWSARYKSFNIRKGKKK